MATRRRPTARAAALPARRGVPDVGRLAPTRRSLLVGLVLLLLAGGGYALARETALFAVERLDVRGGTPAVQAEVRAALAPDLGRSLLRVDGGDLAQRLAGVPDVANFRYDRRFPHTLRVVVHAEQPALVLRVGAKAFLVSTTGRVLRALTHPRASHLPRLYVPKSVQVGVGDELSADHGAAAAAAIAAARAVGFDEAIRFVVGGRNGLALQLAAGLQLRLGDPGDLRLKLTIARRILALEPAAPASGGYLDVSVPERPVLNLNSPVSH